LAIQACPLCPDDGDDVTPLAVGYFASDPVPTKLLQQNVFRRVYEQRASADLHRLAARELLRIEWGAAVDEQIDLLLRRVMNQIRTGVRANGATQALGIDIELRRQLDNESIDLPLVDRRDDVNVERG